MNCYDQDRSPISKILLIADLAHPISDSYRSAICLTQVINGHHCLYLIITFTQIFISICKMKRKNFLLHHYEGN